MFSSYTSTKWIFLKHYQITSEPLRLYLNIATLLKLCDLLVYKPNICAVYLRLPWNMALKWASSHCQSLSDSDHQYLSRPSVVLCTTSQLGGGRHSKRQQKGLPWTVSGDALDHAVDIKTLCESPRHSVTMGNTLCFFLPTPRLF